MLISIGSGPGAVERNVAVRGQDALPPQLEQRAEQSRQRREMTFARGADCAEVRSLKPGHFQEVEPVSAGTGNPARRIDTPVEGIRQQRSYHRRVSVLLSLIHPAGVENRRQVPAFAQRIVHQVRPLPRLHEVADRVRLQLPPVHIPRTKGGAHVA